MVWKHARMRGAKKRCSFHFINGITRLPGPCRRAFLLGSSDLSVGRRQHNPRRRDLLMRGAASLLQNINLRARLPAVAFSILVVSVPIPVPIFIFIFIVPAVPLLHRRQAGRIDAASRL